MKIIDLSLLPTSIDVTVYRYNYLDNKLWTQIKNQVDFIEVNSNSIIITTAQLESILTTNYSEHIDKIKSTGSKFFHSQVNSIYFLWTLLEEMSNLQYIKLTRDFDQSYTRLLVNEGEEKTIEFDFKLLTITLKLADIFDVDELQVINQVLYDLELLELDEPYCRLRSGELTIALDQYLSNLEGEEATDELAIIAELLEIFTYKIERDNPIMLLITDF